MPYEEIDHHADVMFHVWSNSFPGLLEDAIKAMTSVFIGSSMELSPGRQMLKVKSLQIERLHKVWNEWNAATIQSPDGETLEKSASRYSFHVDSASLKGLLFRTLDEYLYLFATENVFCLVPWVKVVGGDVFGSGSKQIKCSLRTIPANLVGEVCGIEVKAVTMHNLRVLFPSDTLEKTGNLLWNAWFVLDI